MHKEKKSIDFGFGNCCADATSLRVRRLVATAMAELRAT